jgi:hypothetical protein
MAIRRVPFVDEAMPYHEVAGAVVCVQVAPKLVEL